MAKPAVQAPGVAVAERAEIERCPLRMTWPMSNPVSNLNRKALAFPVEVVAGQVAAVTMGAAVVPAALQRLFSSSTQAAPPTAPPPSFASGAANTKRGPVETEGMEASAVLAELAARGRGAPPSFVRPTPPMEAGAEEPEEMVALAAGGAWAEPERAAIRWPSVTLASHQICKARPP